MELLFSKAKLLQALEARRAWAIALDKKQAAEHKKAEAVALNKYRKELRTALKYTYKQAKANWRGPSIEHLTCPQSTVQMLDRAINNVTLDGRARYLVREKGSFDKIHYLLTYDETKKPNIC